MYPPPQRHVDPAAEQRQFEDLFALAEADVQEEGDVGDAVVEPAEEEVREAKGDFDAVWESLRPEAERLNKLAEWEADFSQVCLFCDKVAGTEISTRMMRMISSTL